MDRTAQFYAQPSYVRGGALPIFSGSRRQRGGNVLGAIKSFFMPILGNIAKRGVKSAIGLAKDVAVDAFSGKNIKQSLKTRGISRAKRLGLDVVKDAVGQISNRRKAPAPSRKRAPANKAKQRAKRAKSNF